MKSYNDTTLPNRIQTEDPSLVRDTNSKALLNTNVGALARHRRNIAKAKTSASTLTELRAHQVYLESRIADLSDELARLAVRVRRNTR